MIINIFLLGLIDTIMDNEKQKQVTREDLFLLLESYRNMIESNLTLMEKQDSTLKSLENLSVILSEKVTNIVTDKHLHCIKARAEFVKEFKDLFNTNKDTIGTYKDDNQKFNSSNSIKIYGIMGLLITIILTLLGILVKILWP